MRRGSPSSIRPGGIALVVVLVLLVLLSVLLVGFFSTVQTELGGARSYADGASARQLADTAVNVVMGQLTDGTRSFEVPGDPGSLRLTWSSQPGLIRTYDERGGIGRTFKLFSAATMVEPAGTDYRPGEPATLAREIPVNWVGQRALFTDLNEPVVVDDPEGGLALGSRTTQAARFPILDPFALVDSRGSSPGIEGFALGDVPGFAGTWRPASNYNPLTPAGSTTTRNPAPMPVRWIYVLQDGTLTVPPGVRDDGRTADWSSLAQGDRTRPTRDNPIIGRIAFWTDDETCKLNINTASEGTYWDRAIAASNNPASPFGEVQLRDRLPVRNECQRYPGHPATVCLSPVFAALNPAFRLPAGDAFSRADHDRVLKLYYDFAPRLSPGGTFGGTVSTGRNGDALVPLVPDRNRLYASVDEAIFSPPDGVDSAVPAGRPGGRQPLLDETGAPLLNRRSLERARFFLTAYNRAPEVNVFGRPRLSLWMQQQEREPNAGKPSDTTGNRPANCPTRARNARDELLAYCSTIGRQPFFFQRYSIFLGTAVNGRKSADKPFGQLPRYGYAMPSSQSPSLDWTLPRNHQLYAYLQEVTSRPLPGWGGRFTDKYPVPQRDQLLTSMIDHLRSGTNSYAQGARPPAGQVDRRYEYAPARRMPDATMGETQIVPLVPPDAAPGAGTKGYGRFPTITEAMLIFYRSETAGRPPEMRTLLVLEPFSPTAGSWTWSPLVRYVVRGLEKVTVTGNAIANGSATGFFRSRLENHVTSRCGYGGGGNHNTAFTGTLAAFRHWNTGGVVVAPPDGPDFTKVVPPRGDPGDPERFYNLVSDPVPLNRNADLINGRFSFALDGEITIEVHTGYSEGTSAETLVQTIRLRFPPSTSPGWPVPRPSDLPDFNRRIGNNRFNLVRTGDVVRSVEIDPLGPTGGDLRLVAALKEVPPSYFAGARGAADGTGGYQSPGDFLVHSLRNGNGGAVAGSNVSANLFDGLAGRPPSSPGNAVAARGLAGAYLGGDRTSRLLGDFDNGPFDFPDGAYINKPDDYYSAFGGGDRFIDDTTTPNRQVPSPVVFGSIPAVVQPGVAQPWRTLLFTRYPAAGDRHPGFRAPRDHLLLDFFTMPIVEPYAISEPFSTAGKVNLNFEIAPFSYLRRDTALRGVLRSTRLTAIPNNAAYKAGSAAIYRLPIDATQTLDGFVERFRKPTGQTFTGETGAFRTASEICDMPLIPTGNRRADFLRGWWNNFTPTGDNAREAPYGLIYPRVTTRSNTYTVHYRVQVLRQAATSDAADAARWREGRDQQLAEHRGSTLLERYIDPADPALPDFADWKNRPQAAMDDHYKFRILTTKQFLP